MITYPDKPWVDGQEIAHVSSEGKTFVGTYNLAENTWHFRYLTPSTSQRPPIFSDTPPEYNPNVESVEQPLIIGDIWLDTSDQNSRYIWDGDSWVPYPDTSTLQTTKTLPTVNEPGKSLREFAQEKLNQRSINYEVPVIESQYDANHALVEMIAASSGPGNDYDFDLFATRLWVQENYAPLVHVHGEYATTSYVDTAVGNITVPSLDGYATQMWVQSNYSVSSHGHSQYVLNSTFNTKLGDYATKQELEVASNHIELKSTDGLPFFKSTTGSNNARSDLKYYGDTSDNYNIVTRYTVESMLGAYATKAEIPDTSSFITVTDVQNFVTSNDVESYVQTYTANYLTPTQLEVRLASVIPTDIINRTELDEALTQKGNSNNQFTVTYVDSKFAELDLSNFATRQDFTALTATLTAAVNQVAAAVAEKASQQDITLAAAAVDAKFDMLRAAIREATDYDTLKARLLAVLE